MIRGLHHRGPDSEGLFIADDVVLGHCRLAILDLQHGQQPMANEDGTIQVTFNGEIYNHLELRRTLHQCGHQFRTRCDTEVIVHAYEQFGDDCVNHLRGMFAFALWDGHRRRLLLARDHLGKKPLFYAETELGLLFASELQALLPQLGEPQVDFRAIDQYLSYGYVPAPRSAFLGVHKLPPAHLLAVSAERAGRAPLPRRYWQLEYGPKHARPLADLEEQFHDTLTAAVRDRLVADVPVGAMLSGGIDSSLVVALMMREASTPVKTFSIGFTDCEYNELPYARQAADRLGTDHHEFVIEQSAVDVLPTLVRHYGEPFADSSAIPTYHVARLLRQHVTVALNGDGGDECMAGYDRYLGSRLADLYGYTPQWARGAITAALNAAIPDDTSSRGRFHQARRFLRAAELPFAERYTTWVTYFDARAKQQLYTRAFAHELPHADTGEWLRSLLGDTRAQSERLDLLLHADLESYLPFDLLVKMDIATMANSLEARSPFLDLRVIEFAARLPVDLKLRGFHSKYLSKRLARRFLPAGLVHRRKMGFGVPLARWLRRDLNPLLHDVLLSARARERGYFEGAAVARLVAEHECGHDRAQQLWALLWLELWHRTFLDGRAARATPTPRELLPIPVL